MITSLRCVIDASVSIKQFIADPLTPKVNQLFDCLANPLVEFFVPDLFYIESANIFCKYIRAGVYTAAEVQTDLATIKAFPLQVVPTANLMVSAVNIAAAHRISAYDASYVALSQQVNAPLLTLDERLVNALASAPFDVQLFSNFSIPPLPE